MDMLPIPGNEGELLYIARNMRVEDHNEIFATRDDHSLDGLVRDCVAVCRHPDSFGAIVTYDGKPAAVFGASVVRKGVYDVWAFGTKNFEHVGFGLTRFIRKELIPSLVTWGAHRAHCWSLESHREAHAWLRNLGASQHEVPFKGWGKNGETFLLFEWLNLSENG